MVEGLRRRGWRVVEQGHLGEKGAGEGENGAEGSDIC